MTPRWRQGGAVSTWCSVNDASWRAIWRRWMGFRGMSLSLRDIEQHTVTSEPAMLLASQDYMSYMAGWQFCREA